MRRITASEVYETDYTKSINKQRLVYKRTFASVAEYFFDYFFPVVLVFGVTLVTFDGTSVLTKILGGIFDAWTLCNLYFFYKLLAIKVTKHSVSKRKIFDILQKHYNSIQLVKNQEKSVLTFINFGIIVGYYDEIKILRTDEMMYINIITQSRCMPIVFCGLYNYYQCKHIRKIVCTHLAESALFKHTL